MYKEKNIKEFLREQYAIFDYLERKFGNRNAFKAWEDIRNAFKTILGKNESEMITIPFQK